MAKDASKFVSIANGTLTLGQPGNYTFDFTGANVAINRGGGTTLTDAQFAGLSHFDLSQANKVDLTGIAFTDAEHAANHKFEPDTKLDAMLHDMLQTLGVSKTVDMLTVDGSKTGVFELIWDYIDDHYSYYDTTINTYGVQLGIKYAEYLQAGGTPLTDVIAKYTPDGADADTAPDRVQSMHDNLLGNLHIDSIIDKFFDGNYANGHPVLPVSGYATGGSNATPDEATGQALLNQIFAEHLDGRPIYSGSEGDMNYAAAHNWDVSHHLLIA